MELAQTLLSEKHSYETEYELERGKPIPSKNHSKLEIRLGIAIDELKDKIFDIYFPAA